MPDDLDAALQHYREAQAAVGEAERAVVDARAYVSVARAKRDAAIVAAAQRGARQRELVDRTGLTRETIRRILRAGGVENDPE